MWSRLVRRSAIVLLVGVTVLGAGACGGDEETGTNGGQDGAAGEAEHGDDHADGGVPAAATVALKPATFEPSEVTIKVGETVEWKWGGGVQHNVNGEGFKSKLVTKGAFRHTFAEAGTFAYKCDVHPQTMKGTITVA